MDHKERGSLHGLRSRSKLVAMLQVAGACERVCVAAVMKLDTRRMAGTKLPSNNFRLVDMTEKGKVVPVLRRPTGSKQAPTIVCISDTHELHRSSAISRNFELPFQNQNC